MEDFHCPICSKVLIDEDGNHSCDHLAFMHLSLVNDFIEMDDSLDSLIEELQDEDDIVDALVARLGNQIDHYVLSDSGIDSCGVHEVVVNIGIWRQI